MLLRPPSVTRWANSTVGVVVVVLAGMLATDGVFAWEIVLAPLVAAAGIVLAVRGYRLGVVVSETGVVVRGLLATRTLSWDEIDDVDIETIVGPPAIALRDRPWWRRFVLVTAFWVSDGTLLRAVKERAADNRLRLRRAHRQWRQAHPEGV